MESGVLELPSVILSEAKNLDSVEGAGDEGIAPTPGRGMTRRGAVAPADTQRRGSGANYGAPTRASWLNTILNPNIDNSAASFSLCLR